jgi:hypothetical protein
VAIVSILVSLISDVLPTAEAADFNCEDFSAYRHAGVTGGGCQRADVTSLMQGIGMHLNHLGMRDAQTSGVDGLLAEYPEPEHAHRNAAIVGMSNDQSAKLSNEMKLSGAHAQDKQWVSYVLNSLDKTLAVRPSSDVVTISIVLAVIGLTLLASCSVKCFGGNRLDSREGATNPVSSTNSKDKLRFYSRDRRLAPSPNGTLTHASLEQPAQAGFSAGPEESSPPNDAITPSLPLQLPPLCPTLLMPNCSARFGIPMNQIDDLTRNWYGELNIVGISTVPLMRAVVKKIGSTRTLDIFSMAGQNGVPRASLTTSTKAANSRKGLEIHGMQVF